jgi:hypothetical protein
METTILSNKMYVHRKIIDHILFWGFTFLWVTKILGNSLLYLLFS